MCWMQFQNHSEEPGATSAVEERGKALGTSRMFSVQLKHFKRYLYEKSEVT